VYTVNVVLSPLVTDRVFGANRVLFSLTAQERCGIQFNVLVLLYRCSLRHIGRLADEHLGFSIDLVAKSLV